MRKPFTLGQLARLCFDGLVMIECALELTPQALLLDRVEVRGVLEVALGLFSPLRQGLAQRQQVVFGLANHFDQDATLTPTLAAKATHGLFEVAYEHTALDLKDTSGLRQRTGDMVDYLEDFF